MHMRAATLISVAAAVTAVEFDAASQMVGSRAPHGRQR